MTTIPERRRFKTCDLGLPSNWWKSTTNFSFSPKTKGKESLIWVLRQALGHKLLRSDLAWTALSWVSIYCRVIPPLVSALFRLTSFRKRLKSSYDSTSSSTYSWTRMMYCIRIMGIFNMSWRKSWPIVPTLRRTGRCLQMKTQTRLPTVNLTNCPLI